MTNDVADRLALLYDWHNGLRLQRQSADVAFWMRITENTCNVAIMGAGTGRIAVPLALAGRQVVALDLDLARLKRIPSTAGLHPVSANFLKAPLAPIFDYIIFPYSALQLVPIRSVKSALRSSLSALSPSGTIWIDVSESFRTRPAHNWRCVLEGDCPDRGVLIQEWQRCQHYKDHLQLGVRFETRGEIVAESIERWYYHDGHAFAAAFEEAGLVVQEVRCGYDAEGGSHRRIYNLSRPC
jgi:hypothetical protein